MSLDVATVTIATGIATAIATIVSVVLSSVWRLIDRERPAWTLYDGQSAWAAPDRYGNSDPPNASGELANVGRGVALAVRVVGVGCRVTMHGDIVHSDQVFMSSWRPTRTLVPALATGGTVHLRIACEPSEWDRAAIAITWIASPSIVRRRRVELVPLASLAPRPSLVETHTDPETGEVIDRQQPEPDERAYPPDDIDLPLIPRGLHVGARLRRRRALRRL